MTLTEQLGGTRYHGVQFPLNPYDAWQVTGGCSILSPKWMRLWMDARKNDRYGGEPWLWGLTSGGYDPIHPGHISCLIESAREIQKGHTGPASLIVVVNGDEFLTRKKGTPFQPLKVRCQIISTIRSVDYVIPFSASDPDDMGVGEALERIRPHAFLKGGDRCNAENIPEWGICKRLNIDLITGMGDKKFWSSSNFLEEWGKFYHNEKVS